MAMDAHRIWIRGRKEENLDGYGPTTAHGELWLVLANNNEYGIWMSIALQLQIWKAYRYQCATALNPTP